MMKKAIPLILAFALVLSLCACDSLTDAASNVVQNALGDEAGIAFDNAIEQGRQELEDVKEIVKNELETKLQDELDDVDSSIRDAIKNEIGNTVDAVASTTIFTTIPDVSGSEIAILSNFPNAKLIVTLTEYPIGTKLPDPSNESSSTFKLTVDGESVPMLSMQCYAYARYVQHKLYGEHDTKNPQDNPNFHDILDELTATGDIPAGTLTAEKLKEVITAAGPGAHLRTAGKQHSMIVVKVNDDGFTVIDANKDGDMLICETDYRWQEYVDCIFGERGFEFIKVYDPVTE